MTNILCGSAWVESLAYAAEMCPVTNAFCVLNSICSCSPGHFLRNNEAANVAVPRDVEGKCNIPGDYIRWIPGDLLKPKNYIHVYNYGPITPILCQQICEQGQRNGVTVEGRSFSVYNNQCICSTNVTCDIDTTPGFQTYDWTDTVLNECIKCKCTRFFDCSILVSLIFLFSKYFVLVSLIVVPILVSQNIFKIFCAGDPGLYQSEFGFVGPTCSNQCPAGTYGDEFGTILESLCKDCSAGKWSNVTGITSDEGCNNKCSRKYSTATGITSDAACNGACSAGRYATGLTASEECQDCPEGNVFLLQFFFVLVCLCFQPFYHWF